MSLLEALSWRTSTSQIPYTIKQRPGDTTDKVASRNLVILHHALYDNVTWLLKNTVSCREILVCSLAESEETGTVAAVIVPIPSMVLGDLKDLPPSQLTDWGTHDYPHNMSQAPKVYHVQIRGWELPSLGSSRLPTTVNGRVELFVGATDGICHKNPRAHRSSLDIPNVSDVPITTKSGSANMPYPNLTKYRSNKRTIRWDFI